MPRKATTLETIRSNTIIEMRSLGIYKIEYNRVIDVYCSLYKRYLSVNKQIKNMDYEGRTVLCISEENLRRDILKYANELGLTPTGLKKINEKGMGDKKESALAKALRELEHM